jgi:hypothetical protein|nr:MAG TPA: hypothetical protein [Caudoviricetes sp.]
MLSREEILPFESFFISKKDYINNVVVVIDYSEYTDFVQYPGNNKKTKVNKLVFLIEGGSTVTTTSSVVHKQFTEYLHECTNDELEAFPVRCMITEVEAKSGNKYMSAKFRK